MHHAQSSPCGLQQSYGNPAFSPRDAAEEEPGPEPVREAKPHASVAYKVVLRTSDARGAGTNASASVTLHGASAQGQRHLVLNDGSLFDRWAASNCSTLYVSARLVVTFAPPVLLHDSCWWVLRL